MKGEVKRIFKERFFENVGCRPVMDGSQFRKLSLADFEALKALFSLEEIRSAIWDNDESKTPEPDSLNFEFIQNIWSILEAYLINLMDEFHSNTKLPKAIATSFIALVPNIQNPQELRSYKPICLVGCLYKILSKMLASRLKRNLYNVVSGSQPAFVPGK